jgi:sugar (pentulose or hexulose) kinase
MKETPDLNVVIEARREAWSPAPAVPRIGIPAPVTDDSDLRAVGDGILESTADDLRTIATARKEALSRTFTLGTAVLMTGLVAVAAVLAVIVGLWLQDLGMSMDLGGGESTS